MGNAHSLIIIRKWKLRSIMLSKSFKWLNNFRLETIFFYLDLYYKKLILGIWEYFKNPIFVAGADQNLILS